MRKLFFLSIIILPFLFFVQSAWAEQTKVEIYYSQACSDCVPYLQNTLMPVLKQTGIQNIEPKDYISHPEFRSQLDVMMKSWQVPTEMVGHMMTFVEMDGKKILIAGHVPPEMLDNLFNHQVHHFSPEAYPLGIWQDEMHGQPEKYRVWLSGKVGEFPIQTSLDTSLPEVSSGQWSTDKQDTFILPTVLVSGFLDGLNPCAFAVLLFLIAFIFMLKRARLQVLLFGAVYIAAIYLAYLLIGLGLWKAVLFIGIPHLMAKVGSVLVILLGLINIKDYLAPKILPVSLRIPIPARFRLMDWLHKGTLPGTFILGFLVGLCTFPCSGGIYVAIVSLLTTKMTFNLGIFYLLVYNLMFVLPLAIILALAGNRVVTEKLTNLQERNESLMRLVYGLTMIAIGVVILLFFV